MHTVGSALAEAVAIHDQAARSLSGQVAGLLQSVGLPAGYAGGGPPHCRAASASGSRSPAPGWPGATRLARTARLGRALMTPEPQKRQSFLLLSWEEDSRTEPDQLRNQGKSGSPAVAAGPSPAWAG
jgi:hypothetical protein